ncbi:hypothetical protein D3C75_1144050 [compost metagenome]
MVAGDGGQVDFHQRAADAGIAQASTDVIALVDIAHIQALAIGIEAVQRVGQGDFGFSVVSGVVEHAHRFLPCG